MNLRKIFKVGRKRCRHPDRVIYIRYRAVYFGYTCDAGPAPSFSGTRLLARAFLPEATAASEDESEERSDGMEETRRRLLHAGAHSLTLGVLTLVFGVTVGVLGIVNGGKLLHEQKKLR